jgi:hypothetical protein
VSAEQQQLFEFVAPTYTKGATIQQRFEAFHAANPWVYSHLVRLANQFCDAQRSRGRAPKMGIALLVERLRWDYTVYTVTDDPFKICNDYRSRYARLIMEQEPSLRGVFVTRNLKTA